MKPRNLLLLGACAGFSLLAARGAWLVSRDMRRYNGLRAMSGDGPIGHELPEIARQVLAKEHGMPLEFARVLAGLPKDALRYLKIRAM